MSRPLKSKIWQFEAYVTFPPRTNYCWAESRIFSR